MADTAANTAAEATPKASVSLEFAEQVFRLQQHATNEGATIDGTPPLWFRPAGLTATIFDESATHEALSRAVQEEQFAAAVGDAAAPGTVGDLQLVQMQGDYLASLERAYHVRHRSSVRNRIHAAGARKGHGEETGVIRAGLLGFVERLDEFNRAESL